jgi:hypothetical protein
MRGKSVARRNLEKRIAAYCVAAAGGALGLAATASAAVVYTDVNPDQVLTPGSGSGHVYTIDIDGDSTPDIQIPLAAWGTSKAELYGMNGARILATSVGNDDALALNGGYSVGPLSSAASASWHSAPDLWSFSATSSVLFGNWPGQSHKYLGVRIPVGGGSYEYAWVKLSANAARDRITIEGYAYESTPDEPIPAGPVPEPSGLALFGLGAAGIAIWRRRRRKRSAE